MSPWTPVKKVAAAIYVSAVVETGALIAALSGVISWKEAGIAMLAAALPVIAAYLKTDTSLLEQDGVGTTAEDEADAS